MVSVIIPLGLALVMFGVGLTLTYADFRRIAAYPAAVVIALACQMLVMPMLAVGIVKALALEPEYAVGLMLIAASPGGPIANLYSYLAGGDVVLNITLTAVNSILSIVVFPLIVGLAVRYFLGKTEIIPLQTAKTFATMAIVIVPVLLGTSLRSHRISLASSIQPWVKGLSVAFLAGITLQVLYTQVDELRSSLTVIAAAAFFSAASLAVGFLASRLAHLQKNQAIAIGFEVGVHNTGLAVSLALSPLMFNSPRMSVPPTLSGLFSLILACGLAVVVRRKR
jgi:BASS family bile acid:Na+ symporter